MKNILVTGGAGFIGSNFITYMLNKYNDINIVNIDKLTYAGNLANLASIENKSNYKFVKGDICDKDLIEKLLKENEIDTLVNFAAESHVDRSISDCSEFIKTNIMGTQVLLDSVKKYWQLDSENYKEGVRYLQVSTDEVYGSLVNKDDYFRETTPLDPHSPYSASKASADMVVKAYYDTHKLPISITRCSNNYGPYQFPEKLIPLIINNCLNKRKIPVYGDGMNIRDWLYVEDHCIAIDKVLRNGRVGQVYNIGGHNEKSNIDIVKIIIKYLNENIDKNITEGLITYVQDRKGHDKRYGIAPDKIKEELDWQPNTMFEVGIIKTIQWYLDNKEWLDNVTSGEYINYYEKSYKF